MSLRGLLTRFRRYLFGTVDLPDPVVTAIEEDDDVTCEHVEACMTLESKTEEVRLYIEAKNGD